jgi:UDP-3-O-[3-hydroxymyristoyl] glucosamine N-acyltransferase
LIARTVGELAALACATVSGDAGLPIERVSTVDEAVAGTLTFAVDAKWIDKALASKASAVIVPATVSVPDARSKTLIVAADVRAALASILASFAPPRPHADFTHPSAIIEPDVQRGAQVWIGAGAIVRSGATLGDGAILLPGAYVGGNARVGARTLLHPRACVLDECVIGDDCILHSNCVIGSDGFGFVRVGKEQIKIPQIGNVVIGDRVEIGACSTIDRAVTGSTVVGSWTKIDNLVQIGHNVAIGENCLICGMVGISGSVKIGDRVVLAGGVGVTDHVTIGSDAMIAGGSGVASNVPAKAIMAGYPAVSRERAFEQVKHLARLRALFAEVGDLKKRIAALEQTKPA